MAEEKKKLIIIDGNAIVHRSYHALPPLTTNKGELVNAVYGFLLFLFKAVKDLRPDYVISTFDLPGLTFRHEKFEAYKAKRPKAPEELYSQIPRVKEILKAFGVPVFEKQGFEADDVIGTIAKIAAENKTRGTEIVIITGDLDTLQLVGDDINVYTFGRGIKDAVLYDGKKVEERYGGLSPEKLVDYRALKGDPSDNIPGVIGIGEKTAIQLIGEFGSLENIYEQIEKKTEKAEHLKPALKDKLVLYKEQSFLSKELSRIRRDVPIEFNLEECAFGKYDKEKVVNILKELEFHSLIGKLP